MNKTRKTMSKRFVVTKNNKLIHRTSGQDHFNSRETSKVTRNKRMDKVLDKTVSKTIIKYI